MKRLYIVLLFIIPLSGNAGTGHAKDMDLAYLLMVLSLGLIILIWNGFDHLSKNKGKIISSISRLYGKIKIAMSSWKRFHFSRNYS